MPRLIVNADDYGLSPGVCIGILEARAGIVTSTTVMANLVSNSDLAMLIRSGMAAGIHLNLSAGLPVSIGYPAELLNNDGGFNKQLALAAQSWDDPVRAEAAKAEWIQQIELVTGNGLLPTHLDSHHHIHLIPALFGIALELARSLGIGIRTRREQHHIAAAAGVDSPQILLEQFFGDGNLTSEHLMELLESASGYSCVELVCHPGRVDQQLRQNSGYTEERQQELEILSDPAKKHELEQAGWLLSSYTDF